MTMHTEHWTDANGNPAGGITQDTGLLISWQNGPLGRGDDRREPNGAFVERVILAAIDRLAWYQYSQFRCDENERAIKRLYEALDALESRTARRESEQTEGTHAGN